MATQRAIRGVLGNFLSTYTSRYSEYDGYWLFGFLIANLGELRIDLLAPAACESDTPLCVAIRSAPAKFADQVQKADLVLSQIREAWLTIRKLPGRGTGSVNGFACSGHNASFSAGAVMNDGRCFEREQIMFVTEHNAEIERRSARAAPVP